MWQSLYVSNFVDGNDGNNEITGIMIELAGIFVLGGIAILSVYAGCTLSPRERTNQNGEEQYVEVNYKQAMLFPVTASAMLLMIFYFFWLVQYILIGAIIMSASASAYEVQLALFEKGFGVIPGIKVKVIAGIVVANILVLWAFGYWGAHDCLGSVLAIQFISVMRFPNLKTATLCLLLLFVYDAFWVFGSEHLAVFEGKNVMVEVATKQAANPAYEAGAALGWEWMRLLGNAHLELPIKLLYPTTQNSYQMLGLGDIALPGILVNLAYHFDVSCLEREREVEEIADAATLKVASVAMEEGDCGPSLRPCDPNTSKEAPSSQHEPLFPFAMWGYSIGLFVAFASSAVFRVAQPALIYLVPGILIPLVLRAQATGMLNEIWHGMKENAE